MRFDDERERMIEEQLVPRGISDPAVLKAFANVPREKFIDPQYQKLAYIDSPLMIGEGQTISQPFTVAIMTQLLKLSPTDKVLEVGTGSGYQAAILAEIVTPRRARGDLERSREVKGLTRRSGQTLIEPTVGGGQVFTIERFESLAGKARKILKELKYLNVEVIVGDGTKGLPKEQPFDAIIVTAAAPEIPPPLIDQLKIGGRLVMPVDSRPARVDPERSRGVGGDWHQEMVRLTKTEEGIGRENFGGYRFVPLVGEYGIKAPNPKSQSPNNNQ